MSAPGMPVRHCTNKGGPHEGSGSYRLRPTAPGPRSPGPRHPGDAVLVKIEASGLCNTDIHAAHGDWPLPPPLPLVPGHEGVGRRGSTGSGCGQPESGRPRGRAVARLGVRGLRALPVWLGDLLPAGPLHRLLHKRLPCRVHSTLGWLCRRGAGRSRCARRRSLDLRRGDNLQSCQGVGRSARGPGRRVADGGLGHLAVQYARLAEARSSSPSTARTTGWHWQRNSVQLTRSTAPTEDPAAPVKSPGLTSPSWPPAALALTSKRSAA